MLALILIILIPLFLIVILNIKSSYKNIKYIKNNCGSSITIDNKVKTIYINNKKYYFKDLKRITVIEDEQPDVLEKYFTRYAHNKYYADIVFFLKDGTELKYPVSYRNQIYRILKQLESTGTIDVCIDDYKQPFIDGPTFFGLILAIIYILFKSVF